MIAHRPKATRFDRSALAIAIPIAIRRDLGAGAPADFGF